MSFITGILFVVGIVLLIWGADLLVRGSAHLAAMIGISPLIIGLTVVALGTSAPEFAVSVRAVLIGQADLTLGNVIGSNIANVLLILGLAALVAPLLVAPRVLQREVPMMIAASLLLWLLASDGHIGRLDGIVLVVLLVVFLLTTVLSARQGPAEQQTVVSKRPLRNRRTILQNLGLIALGLALLALGAQWLVDGAVSFARSLGISELIIGLTVVAVGTSLPEIATSVLASLRGEREIAVGNVVGSNILNILAVLGLTALFAPAPIAVPNSALAFDLPVMTVVAVACLPIFFNGRMIARWEGGLFLGYYIAYTLYLLLSATQAANLRIFSVAMLTFVIPLTIVTLIVITARNVRRLRS
ncbi:calcium/sodium antiporter [Candidatus Gracilibacteria bacterium]|nr:calcium/sodium antiporter [Candidatus Gracilibacteria bacterium]